MTILPLKDMDSVMLTLAIQNNYGDYGLNDKNRRRLNAAIELAAFAHRNQRRANPTVNSNGVIDQEIAPYIIHPLRNALRIIRWGFNREENLSLVISALLHDTIEDRPEEVINWVNNQFVKDVQEIPTDKSELRRIAFRLMGNHFGFRVKTLVSNVTNPLWIGFADKTIRNNQYAQHVIGVISQDFDVFILKFSDFVDNAMGLHHQKKSSMVKGLATKYLPLASAFVSLADGPYREAVSLSEPDLSAKLAECQGYLENVLATY